MNIIKSIVANIVFGHKGSERRYVAWLRRHGARVGEHVHLYTPWSIIIDISRPWLIEIGDNVHITAGCSILTHDYSWAVIRHVTGEAIGASGKVKIGNNVFIGQKTIVLKGTDIGDNVVIGAGSVVAGKLKPDGVYAGVPARRISSIKDFIEKRRSRLLGEATELVNEYEEVYGREPGPEELKEFFWLFQPRDLTVLPSCYRDQLETDECYEKASAAFLRSSASFDGIDDFLQYCHSVSKYK